MIKILFIDNRDSFAYNIVEMLRQSGTDPVIVTDTHQATSDREYCEVEIPDLDEFDGIVLSPGAGVPAEYPIMQRILKSDTTCPILGICLGHQAIAETAGAQLECMARPLHGHTSTLHISEPRHAIFDGINEGTPIGRYHSWVVDAKHTGSDIDVIAWDEDGNIQAIAQRSLPRIGLQFHPESIITTEGRQIIGNWLSIVDKNQ